MPIIENEIVEVPRDWAMPLPYHKTIELADDTVIDGYAMQSTLFSDNLWVYPERTDYSYMDVALLFSDPNKTSIIRVHMSETETVIYTGYTRVSSINQDGDNKYTICLAKPSN